MTDTKIAGTVNTYDSKGDTLEHIRTVQRLLNKMIRLLSHRADWHDASKLEAPEKEYFDRYTPLLSGVTYGSDEYRQMLKDMRPAIEHHHMMNPHHPEHYGSSGIMGMNLIDLLEMICDWKAATLRHNDGDIHKSIEINAKRFGLDEQLFALFRTGSNNDNTSPPHKLPRSSWHCRWHASIGFCSHPKESKALSIYNLTPFCQYVESRYA